jgi:hypothetical protein
MASGSSFICVVIFIIISHHLLMENSSATSVDAIKLKKSYPFGTPNHGKSAFSELAHLDAVNRSFATKLGHSAPEPVYIRPPVEKPKTIKPLPDAVLNIIPETKKGQAPCGRSDCKEVVNQIIDVVAKNQIERNDIIEECEKLIALHQQYEEDSYIIENDNKRLLTESNVLEMKLSKIQAKLGVKEQIKSSLESDKDELNSKVIMRYISFINY